MKAIVNSSALYKQLQRVTPVIAKNVSMPILSSVKLDFQKKKLIITGTDLETTIQTSVVCDTKKPFTVLMEFADISNFCSKTSDQPITIEETEKAVTVTGDNSKFKFTKPGEVEHYPTIPEENFIFDYEADGDFFWAMTCANKCRSLDDLRVNMNAVCIEIKKDTINVVATDALILYLKKFPIKSAISSRIMICDKFIGMIKSFTDGKISVGEKFIKVQKDDVIIISRLKDAKFVDYTVIIPENPEYNFKALRKDLLSAVELTTIAANAESKTCRVGFVSPNEVKISSEDVDFGKEGETNIKSDNSVSIQAIGVNGSQFLKILNIFDSDTVEMQIIDPKKIIAVKSSDKDDTTLCLIQPVYINEPVTA